MDKSTPFPSSSSAPYTSHSQDDYDDDMFTPRVSDKIEKICESLRIAINRPLPQVVAAPLVAAPVAAPLVAAQDPARDSRNRMTELRRTLVAECFTYLNCASKEELKALKGIGERRATRMIVLREAKPFMKRDDLKKVEFTDTQIRSIMREVMGDL